MKKLVFLDVDDTILSPPHAAVDKVLRFYAKSNPPSEAEMSERPHIDFCKSFPDTFKSKMEMWALVLQAIPFGFFKSYNLIKEINKTEIADIISDDRVFLVTKNPPIFSRWRIRRIWEITGVDIRNRYIACGPIFRKSTPKLLIFQSISTLYGIKPSDCLVIDDDPSVVDASLKKGYRALLVSTTWNASVTSLEKIAHKRLTREIKHFLGSQQASLVRSSETLVFPHGRVLTYISSFFWIMVNRIKTGSTPTNICFLDHSYIFSLLHTSLGANREAITGSMKTNHPNEDGNQYFLLWTKHGFVVPFNTSNCLEYKASIFPPLYKMQRIRAIAKSFYQLLDYRFTVGYKFTTIAYRRRDLIEAIYSDITMSRRSLKNDPDDANRKFYTYAKEMISSRYLVGCLLVYNYFCLMCSRKFRQVNVSCSTDLKSVESKYYTIYAGLHRSVYDSALLVKFLAEHSDHIPFIPAADKMRSNWVGKAGTLIGTFYIRREKVDILYQNIMGLLIKHIFRSGTPLAIFLEGRRSRSGLTLSPKSGIFKLLALEADKLKDIPIAIVPLSFSYNKIPESDSMLDEVIQENEASGSRTPREHSDVIIKGRSTSKYQRFSILSKLKKIKMERVSEAFITAGDPIIIRDIGEDKSIATRNEMAALLHKVMCELNTTVPPLATSIACLGILTAQERHIYAKNLVDFMNLASLFIKFLHKSHYKFLVFKGQSDFISELNSLPFINSKFKRYGVAQDDIISLTDLDITTATHYRNNVLHYFIVPSWISYLMISCKSGSVFDILNHIENESSSLSNKFFIHPENFSRSYLKKIINLFHMADYIDLDENIYYVKEIDGYSPFELCSRLGRDLHKQYSMKMIHNTRRLNRRYSINYSCSVEAEQEELQQNLLLTNISLTGGFIQAKRKHKMDKDILIKMQSDNSIRSVLARVVRVDDNGYAFKFLFKDESQHSFIKGIISNLTATQKGTTRPLT